MLVEIHSRLYDKDIKILHKKHYNFSRYIEVIGLLKEQKQLPGKYKDHTLVGNYKNYRECHIDDNIILIYQIINNENLLLYRIGTHGDLLKK